jgi:putative phosphoesterase
MKTALISDIHGNVVALESVLLDIKLKSVDKIINLGDSLYGPLWPQETAELLISKNIESILGNGDEDLLSNNGNNRTIKYTVNCLEKFSIEWLRNLKKIYVYNDITCFHGKQNNNREYLIEKIENGIVKVKSVEEISNEIKNCHTSFIACGHSHIERIIKVNDKTVINAGSVGLPAYNDTKPIHKMESYNTKAKYIVIEDGTINIVYVYYDNEKAAKQARRNGRKDWEYSLLYGRA